jgi:hypothetical protein
MYTREALARRIAAGTVVYKYRSRILAVFSVVGGLGQLVLHRIIERDFARPSSLRIELALFIIYIVIVVAMIVWMNKGVKAATPRCESCGTQLRDMSGRMALTTGRCDQCGAQVIE